MYRSNVRVMTENRHHGISGTTQFHKRIYFPAGCVAYGIKERKRKGVYCVINTQLWMCINTRT